MSTSISRKVPIAICALFTAALFLSSCGASNTPEEEAGADADPATTRALEDELLVDPDLVEGGNTNNALDPNGPRTGGVPSSTAIADSDGEGRRKGLISAPEPKIVSAEECADCEAGRSGITLGAQAEIQSNGRGNGACNADLEYDARWATRMPAQFKVYPRARVKEAAGVDGGKCDIRAVTFTTPVALKEVVDYYYTRARNGKYSAEYVLRDGEHIVGGVRKSDEAAYAVFLRTLSSGLTEVDIVASNGR